MSCSLKLRPKDSCLNSFNSLTPFNSPSLHIIIYNHQNIKIMSKYFAESELIINEDGSCFHLHLRPEQVADKVILVGDPGRVALVASHFETQECEVASREFHASTGIGCDNIDIVVNELDALKNIDFTTRTEKPEHTTLTLVRIGTCGGLQLNCPAGTFVASQKSIGFDGLINFYARRNEICDLETEAEFKRQVKWNDQIGNPYCVNNDPELLNQIAGDDMVRGITIACGGFYGPQGRELRAPLADPELNAKIEEFEYKGLRVNNFEMESSALAGLSLLLGHKALTCCMVIANRRALSANTGYKSTIDNLIKVVLDRI